MFLVIVILELYIFWVGSIIDSHRKVAPHFCLQQQQHTTHTSGNYWTDQTAGLPDCKLWIRIFTHDVK